MRKPTIKMIRAFRERADYDMILGSAGDFKSYSFGLIRFQGYPILKKNGKPMFIEDFHGMSDKKFLKRIILSMKLYRNE